MSGARLAALGDSGAYPHPDDSPPLRSKSRVEAETAVRAVASRSRGKNKATDHQPPQTQGGDEGGTSRGTSMCQGNTGCTRDLTPAHPPLELHVWLNGVRYKLDLSSFYTSKVHTLFYYSVMS